MSRRHLLVGLGALVLALAVALPSATHSRSG